MKQSKGVWLVVIGAALWGFMGVFVRGLTALGFDSMQVAAIRITVAALTFAVVTLVRDRKLFVIRLRDGGWFLAAGTAVLCMTASYSASIQALPMSTAAILLYTAPIIVMAVSVVFLKEPLTWQKLVSLVIAFAGCFLITGWGGVESGFGLAMALFSAFSYAMYTVLGSVLLRRYPPLTVTTYAFAIAAVGALAICNLPDMLSTYAAQTDGVATVLWSLGCGWETAVLPFLLYTSGLRYVGAGQSAVLSYIEPMVATLTGIVAFGEPFTVVSGIGVSLIVGAAVLLNSRELFASKN